MFNRLISVLLVAGLITPTIFYFNPLVARSQTDFGADFQECKTEDCINEAFLGGCRPAFFKDNEKTVVVYGVLGKGGHCEVYSKLAFGDLLCFLPPAAFKEKLDDFSTQLKYCFGSIRNIGEGRAPNAYGNTLSQVSQELPADIRAEAQAEMKDLQNGQLGLPVEPTDGGAESGQEFLPSIQGYSAPSHPLPPLRAGQTLGQLANQIQENACEVKDLTLKITFPGFSSQLFQGDIEMTFYMKGANGYQTKSFSSFSLPTISLPGVDVPDFLKQAQQESRSWIFYGQNSDTNYIEVGGEALRKVTKEVEADAYPIVPPGFLQQSTAAKGESPKQKYPVAYSFFPSLFLLSPKSKIIGEENVLGQKTIVVETKLPNGEIIKHWLMKDSGFPIKEGNFVNGLPFTMEYTGLAINRGLPESIFDLPDVQWLDVSKETSDRPESQLVDVARERLDKLYQYARDIREVCGPPVYADSPAVKSISAAEFKAYVDDWFKTMPHQLLEIARLAGDYYAEQKAIQDKLFVESFGLALFQKVFTTGIEAALTIGPVGGLLSFGGAKAVLRGAGKLLPAISDFAISFAPKRSLATVYHYTPIGNLPGILSQGLKPGSFFKTGLGRGFYTFNEVLHQKGFFGRYVPATLSGVRSAIIPGKGAAVEITLPRSYVGIAQNPIEALFGGKFISSKNLGLDVLKVGENLLPSGEKIWVKAYQLAY